MVHYRRLKLRFASNHKCFLLKPKKTLWPFKSCSCVNQEHRLWTCLTFEPILWGVLPIDGHGCCAERSPSLTHTHKHFLTLFVQLVVSVVSAPKPADVLQLQTSQQGLQPCTWKERQTDNKRTHDWRVTFLFNSDLFSSSVHWLYWSDKLLANYEQAHLFVLGQYSRYCFIVMARFQRWILAISIPSPSSKKSWQVSP